MRFELTVQMNNSAFGNDPSGELCRILHDLSDHIGRNGFSLIDNSVRSKTPAAVRDYNGNVIGTWQVLPGDYARCIVTLTDTPNPIIHADRPLKVAILRGHDWSGNSATGHHFEELWESVPESTKKRLDFFD